VQVAPGIYQELVEKKAEWRVTVVGNNLFPVRIDSQKSPETAVDWRRNQLADMYDLAELDPELGRKLLKVHEQLGLIYGAYDLIERPDGEMVFLECNPAGQWLWLEEATGPQIADCLGLFLTQASKVNAGAEH
jgi:glutathione synthase/RimK-type ligase-like ATP-grasp enzyme